MSINEQKGIGERLKFERCRLGLTQAELAERAGMPVGSLKGYERGKRVPGGEALAALAKAGVDVAFVLTGQPSKERIVTITGRDIQLAGRYYTPVPILSVEVSAGAGRLADHAEIEETLAFPTRMLRQHNLDPAELHLLTVRGDSMEPTLREDDLVLVDRAARKVPVRDGGVYVLCVGDEVLIKRIQYGRPPIVRLLSDNGTYPPIEVDLEKDALSVIGRVRMVMRWM